MAGEAGTASLGINTWGGMVAAGYGDGSPDNADPKAFANIVLFDKNYNFLDVAYAQLKGTSLYYMSANYTVKEAGYAYLYVSNEQANMTDVYFDDVKMSYTPGNILQSNACPPELERRREYYPFGLQTANSWTRDNTTNNFLANGGTELNTTSALYDLEFRNYDPILGRMNQVDPLADIYGSFSVYHYSYNNPVRYKDPSGAATHDGDWETYNYHPEMMDGRGGGGGRGVRDEDHPFAGWMGGMSNGYSEYGMFGDLGDTPFGSGMIGQMQADAQAVKDGRMSLSSYAAIYGQNIGGDNIKGLNFENGGFWIDYDTQVGKPSSDGKGMDLIAKPSRFVSLDNALTQSGVPTFQELWDNYPMNSGAYLNDKIWNAVGGKVKQNHDSNPTAFANSCTIRMSKAFNDAGYDIPFMKGQTMSGADGNWYYYRVKNFDTYVTGLLGAPDITGTNISSFQGHQGIIEFQVTGWGDASGHFTLWNGSTTALGEYWNNPGLTNVKLWILN